MTDVPFAVLLAGAIFFLDRGLGARIGPGPGPGAGSGRGGHPDQTAGLGGAPGFRRCNIVSTRLQPQVRRPGGLGPGRHGAAPGALPSLCGRTPGVSGRVSSGRIRTSPRPGRGPSGAQDSKKRRRLPDLPGPVSFSPAGLEDGGPLDGPDRTGAETIPGRSGSAFGLIVAPLSHPDDP